ncbi:camp-dependent protein kinase catalytic subunit [Tritrichomonas musculus]|uniref:Camp-dependent protein kinase catalytic subunit n=1 Tax=Tritrichomonas musculus TaxID=1915356 RepID=A0ABR2H5I4_9EUKA
MQNNNEMICVLKNPNILNSKIIEREAENYVHLSKGEYPFISRYFGYFDNYNEKCLFIEYIEGRSLDRYDLKLLSLDDLLTIRYLHSQRYIYRDMKYDNIIINENKDAILFD